MQTSALLTFFRIINLRIPDLLSNFALILTLIAVGVAQQISSYKSTRTSTGQVQDKYRTS